MQIQILYTSGAATRTFYVRGQLHLVLVRKYLCVLYSNR